MWFFTPRYLKHGRLLLKGVDRFINYKRDILPAESLEKIVALRNELKDQLKKRNKDRVEALHDEINNACQRSLPNLKNSEIGENVEVFFVAIVVALGIRAYIAQPFQIPTGSMQPTLNGINTGPLEEGGVPSMPMRFVDWLGGRSHIDITAPKDGWLRRSEPLTERTWNVSIWPPALSILTPHTLLHYDDGTTVVVKGPKDKVLSELGLGAALGLPFQRTGAMGPDMREINRYYPEAAQGPIVLKKGQQLAEGVIDWGDHVLVNKMAYHFRKPDRGEVFVFTTKNIDAIGVPPEQGSQHYIKRLVGVPGDELEQRTPQLLVNGQPAEELGIQKVASAQDGYRGYGAFQSLPYLHADDRVKLGPEQYWAMGDNSYNSSDSRYWGHVPQRNLVGPGLFCYLPFNKHWGPIR
jgi:signal peptidase I